MKANLTIAFAGVAIAAAGAASTAVWYLHPNLAATVPAARPAPAHNPTRYVPLDKVIVMLRRAPGEPAHYLALDLVLATAPHDEQLARDQLPLLRSLAVSTLSAHTLAEASAMTVDAYAAELTQAFDASYTRDHHLKPFSAVMVGKLVIE